MREEEMLAKAEQLPGELGEIALALLANGSIDKNNSWKWLDLYRN